MSTTKSSAEFAALINKLSAFVENEVIPTEDLRISHDAHAIEESIQALRQRAVAQGLGNPRRPVSEGGLGLSWEECCSYLEQAGRSFLGPGALQCAAPGQPDHLERARNDHHLPPHRSDPHRVGYPSMRVWCAGCRCPSRQNTFQIANESHSPPSRSLRNSDVD